MTVSDEMCLCAVETESWLTFHRDDGRVSASRVLSSSSLK